MISAIAAVDADFGIGYDNQLLECIPEDLKYFKTLTTDHAIIMGRKTADSGRFQTAEWRRLCSRADSIWYTDGKNNERVPKNFIRNFELNHPKKESE